MEKWIEQKPDAGPGELPRTTRASILERNVAALSKPSPRMAAMLRHTPGRTDVFFATTPERDQRGRPVLSASLMASDTRGLTAAPIRLASHHEPLAEGDRLADTIDLRQAGIVVVMGFGVGHHVASLARRMKRRGVIYVFEPDVALLKSVLERIDCSDWISQTNLVILHEPDDTGAVSSTAQGLEALVALGVKFLHHPPSKRRLGDSASAFMANVTNVVRAMRTNIVTTLVHADLTMRNLFMNVDHYAFNPGVADLTGLGQGKPAVVVSAGPSLRRNLDLLTQPGIRDRVVIIAVQTVLKQLLARGIRPHFVTALDYAEISTRFYEGLTAKDVEGITLVAEAKANPAILSAFPGAIRCPADPWLDLLLGPELAGTHGALRAGSTVAHLAYYLARHLACEPVILIGQDLGFTDGQYYGPKAAIHQVWAGELNSMHSLEALEWQRIMRWRRNLIRAKDHLGRPVYSDEQMATYRVQFERDFADDAAKGLATIDATEGGVAKQHTQSMPLADALARFAPRTPAPFSMPDARAALPSHDRVRNQLARVREQAASVASASRETAEHLRSMLDHHSDQRRVNALIAKVEAIRDSVQSVRPGFDLTQHLNQTGLLKRVRADRDLDLADDLEPLERQRKQIERDVMNVTWLADAADELGRILEASRAALNGQPKITRPPPPDEATLMGETSAAARKPKVVHATITVAVDSPAAACLPSTLARLARCARLDGLTIVTDRPEALLAQCAGSLPRGTQFHAIEGPLMRPSSARAVRAARAFARSGWRGGIGNMTVFDEVFDPTTLAPILRQRGIDAAIVLGADWSLVDPVLVDRIIERYREAPEKHRVVFTQAAPGLAPALVEATMMSELAAARSSPISATFSTLGGALGYIPIAPVADPIASPNCVLVPPALRDLECRMIADHATGRESWSQGDLIEQAARRSAMSPPAELLLELTTQRRGTAPRLRWAAHTPERREMPSDDVRRILDAVRSAWTNQELAVSFSGRGEPTEHPALAQVVEHARSLGYVVHVRTDLIEREGEHLAEALHAMQPDIISVDVLAHLPATYAALHGIDGFDRVRAGIDRLLDLRTSDAGGLPTPWIVPRITRCDAVYEEIEPFYDTWVLKAGAASIDPLPRAQHGERIEPLPVPVKTADRLQRSRLTILADGRLLADERALLGASIPTQDIAVPLHTAIKVVEAWSRIVAERDRSLAATRETHVEHPLWL